MDSTKCEAFLAAAEHGSLTIAAEIMGYTQPGITRIIHSLENECGFPLLARTPKGVQLTENGKSLLPYFREIVRAQKSMEELCGDISGMRKGTLTIGSYFSISSMMLPSIFKLFRQSYPHIYLKLREGTSADLSRWLSEKTIDCLLGQKPGEDFAFDWIPVFEDEMVVWLPENHPRAHDRSFPIEELNREPFIISHPDNDTDVDRLLARNHIHPHISLSTIDTYTSWKMVEAGLGISLDQSLLSRGWKGKVVTLPFDPPQKITLGIAVPSLKEISPSTRKFIDCVLQNHPEKVEGVNL